MSKRVVWSLMDSLRSFLKLEDGIPFLLAHIAWVKYSDEHTKVGTSCQFLHVIDKASSLEDIKKIFIELANNEAMGPKAKAFSIVKNWDKVSNLNDLSKFYNLLKSATISKAINYQEVTEMLMYESSFLYPAIRSVDKELCRLMCDVVNNKENGDIYCPFLYGIALAYTSKARKNSSIYTEYTGISPELGAIVNFLNDSDIKWAFNNPFDPPTWLSKDGLQKFDYSIAVAPFGMLIEKEVFELDRYNRFSIKSSQSETVAIQHILAQTKKKAVIAVPFNLLSKSSKSEISLKKQWLDNRCLEGVIALTSHIFKETTTPTALLIFNLEQKSDTVFFVNASKQNFYNKEGKVNRLKNIENIIGLLGNKETTDISTVVKHIEIEQNNYNLLVDQYVLSPEVKALKSLDIKGIPVKLSDIAEIIRPQTMHSSSKGESITYNEITIHDIPKTGYTSGGNKKVEVKIKDIERAKRQQLQPLDILLSTKATLDKAGIVTPDLNGNWLASQSFHIIRLKKNSFILNPIVLYMYLKTSFAKGILKNKATGSAILSVPIGEIRNLPVHILTLEEQNLILADFQQENVLMSKIKALQAKMESITDRNWIQK